MWKIEVNTDVLSTKHPPSCFGEGEEKVFVRAVKSKSRSRSLCMPKELLENSKWPATVVIVSPDHVNARFLV